MMNEFEITWIKNPVEDILGIGTLGIHCGTFCIEKTPESCSFYCKGHVD